MNNNQPEDLGFRYTTHKGGDVFIERHSKPVTTIRGNKAVDFISKINLMSFAEQQQLMARLTGNYKRGNEKTKSR